MLESHSKLYAKYVSTQSVEPQVCTVELTLKAEEDLNPEASVTGKFNEASITTASNEMQFQAKFESSQLQQTEDHETKMKNIVNDGVA